MVKHFTAIFICMVILSFLIIPSFAVDNMQSDSDLMGFSYDSSKILFGASSIEGNKIRADSSILDVTSFYFYIPVSYKPEKLDFYFTLALLEGSFTLDSCDWGYVYSNSFHYQAAITAPSYAWVGTSSVTGSSVKFVSYRCSWSNMDFFSDAYAGRYIRLKFINDTNYGTHIRFCTYMSKDTSVSESGTYVGTQKITEANKTLSGSFTEQERTFDINSGSLITQSHYISGSYRSYYDSTHYSTVALNNSTTSPYLLEPSYAVRANSTNYLSGKIASKYNNTLSGTISQSAQDTGTNTGTNTSSWTNTEHTFIDTVMFTATRSYNDADLIQHVDDGFSQNHTDLTSLQNKLNDFYTRNHTDLNNFYVRNHNDLVSIGDDLQAVVDHMNGLEQQGQQINGTTSQSTINNASSAVSSGSSAMTTMGGTVSSGITSSSQDASGYLSLLTYGFNETIGFGPSGNKPLLIAVYFMVFIPVGIFIVRRLL